MVEERRSLVLYRLDKSKECLETAEDVVKQLNNAKNFYEEMKAYVERYI